MTEHSDQVGIILSRSTTREAICQLLEQSERGDIREGMLLLVEASPHQRKLLCRVSEIVPYHDFFTEGDPWSEARRKNLPLPEQVARRYEVCKLELLAELPGSNEVTIPPHPGDYVYRIELQALRERVLRSGTAGERELAEAVLAAGRAARSRRAGDARQGRLL